MTFMPFVPALNLFFFETVVSLIIIISCILVYKKCIEFFSLSLQKGIKYFGNAFLFFAICFFISYAWFIIQYFSICTIVLCKLVFGFALLYTGGVGGLYLGYSLMWRMFEKDRVKRSHPIRTLIIHTVSLIIAGIELWITILSGNFNRYLFFGLLISYITIGVILNCRKCSKNKKCSCSSDPFLSSVVLAIGIYIAIFIEGFIWQIVPATHYYIWGVIAVFFHAVYHNVSRLSGAGK